MIDPKKNNKKTNAKKQHLLLVVSKWLISIIIFLFLLILLSSPLRGKAADNYVENGDSFLLQKKYVSAELEYKKALALDSKNAIAKDHLNLTQRAATNIEEFERFSDLPQFSDFKSKYETANTVPSTQSDAVKLSKKLIEDGEYQLSIIPAKTALEMDNEYKDAWLYLGIANLKTAQLAELKPEAQSQYLSEAKKSFDKVLQLDPENTTARELIGKI